MLSRTFAVVLLLATLACGKDTLDHDARNGRSYGPAVSIGHGTARVYVDVNNGEPVEVGVALSETALNGLPDHHAPGGVEIEPGHMMFMQVLEMPAVNPTPFRHVTLGWNPGGHEPKGVYDKPHFDFHFYTISDAARRAIDPKDTRFAAKAASHPAGDAAPAGYVAIPGAVPFMGAHWVNPKSPELNGSEFDQTFLFGSWDGRLIFAEPMITRKFLESKPDYLAQIPLASHAGTAAHYPGTYRIRWSEKSHEFTIALRSFEWRTK